MPFVAGSEREVHAEDVGARRDVGGRRRELDRDLRARGLDVELARFLIGQRPLLSPQSAGSR